MTTVPCLIVGADGPEDIVRCSRMRTRPLSRAPLSDPWTTPAAVAARPTMASGAA